ncbi:MAG: TetR/AcrR family transcriptional regulator [Candidatus Acidiferrales bacterium]
MPRHADAELEGHILDAAYRLLSKGGEKALTMRAVARAAETTTPTVYERFRDKDDILQSLRARAQRNLFMAIKPARSLAELCKRYFDFALKHPNEYDLLHADWAHRYARSESLLSFDLLKTRLAARLGGSPHEHVRLALALAALVHGASMILLTKGIEDAVVHVIREATRGAFEALVEDAASHRLKGNRAGTH